MFIGLIKIKNVSKSFGNHKVLEDVSFTVGNGEIAGYVGLNGAGKTTTIRIAVGVLPPDNGDAIIDGISVTKEKKRASERIGWVPELPIFETDFKVIDYFLYIAGYYGISVDSAKRLAKEKLEMLELGNALNMKLAALSQGMKKRFALAVSLINDPPNFIFDEVLNGLDPQGIVFFRELALKFKSQGKAVLFSSHILSEVQGIADKVVFIHKGKILGVYKMNEIADIAKPAIILKVDKVNESLYVLKEFGKAEVRGESIALLDTSASTGEIVKALLEHGINVLELKQEEKGLEEFFFRLIKDGGN